ncbi:UvrD-helicase domain-containing protein [bacterium SCSIO 12696]|nr:UvrD-helicase domain-containing protein [bacterium SCSIO 12696]
MSQPSDFQQRQQALNPEGSFAVSAPAGSGKTGLLTQRVLTLLATCQHPEEVLAITFTRKAAAEMRHRIVDALQQAESEEAPSAYYQRQTWELARKVLERDRELGWQLLSVPGRLRILTIDGLCRNLARQLVLENGLGELPQPAEDPQPLYREAVTALFATLGNQSPDNHTGNALASLLKHLDNNWARLEALLTSLLAKREQWLSHILAARSDEARRYLEQQLQQTITETLVNTQEKLQPFASDLSLLLDYAANNLSNSHPDHPLCQLQGIQELPEADAHSGYIWQVITGLLLINSGDWRKSVDVRSGFPAGKGEPKERKEQLLSLIAELKSVDGLQELLLDIRSLPYPQYPQQQWQVLQALTDILPQLSAQLSLVFLHHGQCDFTEVTLAALRALGDEDQPTDTALRLDYRIRHILVDEFQDTSSSQFQLLRRLTAGWQPDDGRTLFIVGDGMQSLYGFRSANVGLFLEARRHPIGQLQLQPLDLTVNFRSQSKLVAWTNDHFQQAFPQQDNITRGAVRYNQAQAFNSELAGQAVTLDGIVDSDNRQLEAELVVEKIQLAKASNPSGSIAVLVRNRNHLQEILPALYQAGLSWQAIDIEPLATRMAVIDLHSLTRALLSPADRIAWLAILRAPWCGLSLADIHSLANTPLEQNPKAPDEHYPLLLEQLRHFEQLPNLTADGRAILRRVVPLLLDGLQQRGRKPIRTWIEGLWLALGGPSALLDANDIRHVRRYLDLLEQHSGSGHIDDWEVFNRALKALYATPPSGSDENLQLMTIHKSKGLEFDTVIIPGLDRATASNDSEILLWRERIDQAGHPQLLLGPLQASGDGQDSLFEHLKNEAKLKTRLENTRVIYVGATRAIQRLHLLFHINSGNKDDFKPPNANSLLAPLWQQFEPQLLNATEHCQLHYETQKSDQSEQVASLTHYGRLPPSWQPPDLAGDPLLAPYRGRASGYKAAQDNTSNNNDSARHTGTVLHRTLQQVVSEGINQWDQQRIQSQQPFWRSQLQQLGACNDDLNAAVNSLEKAMAATLTDIKGQWLLDNNHAESQCEWPLSYQTHKGQQRLAVIDRTFIADGERWIIDYKSSKPDSGQALEDFLQQQRALYTPQLKHYQSLLKQLENKPTRLALYFPCIPHFIEL